MKNLVVGGWLLAACAAFGAVEMQQKISLEEGWNAVHVQVADTNDVDDLFGDWPVESVSLYKSDAFLETRQFSAEGSNEGLVSSGYRTWWRGKGIRGFAHVPADSVLVCFATNEHSCVLYGAPAAPRIAWHVSKGEEGAAPLNLVGLSVADNAETTPARYFSGMDISGADVFVFGGDDPSKPLKLSVERMGLGATFGNAQVFAVASSKVSDWSGVLHVSPRDGLAFGGEVTKGRLEVRNDGATNVIATVGMSSGKTRPGGKPAVVPPGLYARDSLDALTNGPWTAFTDTKTLRRELLAGETWAITFAVDLLQLSDGNVEYGAILEIRDETAGGSAMCAHVPLTAARDGASEEFAWPKGVWSAAAELDTVNFMVTSEENGTFKKTDEGMKKAGGKMTVRLPLYVDESGKMTLLQRLWFGRNTNGVLRAYSGAVETSDEPLAGVQRLSTPFLPTDQPQIAFSSGTVFGSTARASFVVGEKSGVNPMRHAQHPQHDGLTADYESAAPSGDDLGNYIGLVKPETFSISNRIEFAWDENDAARWNPAETLTGTLTWEFDGLRHEGTVRAKGRFAMKRLSPVTVKMK